MPTPILTDSARGVGGALARRGFEHDSEVRLREDDLAALLALAYRLGREHTLEGRAMP
jgi:hypothetical protein